MRKIFFILTLISFSVIAKDYIDSETLANDKNRRLYLNELKEKNEYGCEKTNFNCMTKYTRLTRESYPYRGIKYAQQNYINYTKGQAFERLLILSNVYQEAKDNNFSAYDREDGMISQKEVLEEGWYIFKEILKFDPTEPQWDYFYRDSKKNSKTLINNPFIDNKCNALLKEDKALQIRILTKCPTL